jgi:hypothetical protein
MSRRTSPKRLKNNDGPGNSNNRVAMPSSCSASYIKATERDPHGQLSASG